MLHLGHTVLWPWSLSDLEPTPHNASRRWGGSGEIGTLIELEDLNCARTYLGIPVSHSFKESLIVRTFWSPYLHLPYTPYGIFTCLFTCVCIKHAFIHIHFRHFDLCHCSPPPGDCPDVFCSPFWKGRQGRDHTQLQTIPGFLWHRLVKAESDFPES